MTMTTTLMSLSTPRPLIEIPPTLRNQELMTILASNMLKKSSSRKANELAKVFRAISMKKIVKKYRSIVSTVFYGMGRYTDRVRSYRMNTVYNPIVVIDTVSK